MGPGDSSAVCSAVNVTVPDAFDDAGGVLELLPR